MVSACREPKSGGPDSATYGEMCTATEAYLLGRNYKSATTMKGQRRTNTKTQRKALLKVIYAAFLCGFVPLCLCVFVFHSDSIKLAGPHGARVIDVDDLNIGVEIQRGGALFTFADTGGLHPAKGDLGLAAHGG